jgi:hypothetical protein
VRHSREKLFTSQLLAFGRLFVWKERETVGTGSIARNTYQSITHQQSVFVLLTNNHPPTSNIIPNTNQHQQPSRAVRTPHHKRQFLELNEIWYEVTNSFGNMRIYIFMKKMTRNYNVNVHMC